MIEAAKTLKTVVVRRLLDWYEQEKRSLPWRETSDPYRIWISEIMLQQTQVDTVIPYYRRFLEAFPTVRDLANASLQDILKVWENMGYYARARNLHTAAGIITVKFNGQIPDTREALNGLPGIGAYTAGAILSMAYGHVVPAVDGNVRRILSRLFAIRTPADHPPTQRRLQQIAQALVPHKNPGDFNQALMDLGATICKTKNPRCSACPLATLCLAKASELQNLLPVSGEKPTTPHRQAVSAIIRNHDGMMLIVQRPATGLLASLWTLPGGFIKESENMGDHLKKIVKEELGVSIRVGAYLASVNHVYTHFRTTLHAFEGRLLRGKPQPRTCQDWRWASRDALRMLPLSKIDRLILAAVL